MLKELVLWQLLIIDCEFMLVVSALKGRLGIRLDPLH